MSALDDDATERVARWHASLAAGPDPEEAPARLHRFVAAAAEAPGGLLACVPDEVAERLLVLLLGQSGWLARELIRDPARLGELAADPWLSREKPLKVMHAQRAAAVALAGDASVGLRRFRRAEYLRLGARELGYGAPRGEGGDVGREVGRELSALASACLQGALDAAWSELSARYGAPLTDEKGRRVRCRFVVFGMGKLGGEELNFSSDIDVIYVYESDVGVAGRLTLHEFFTRLAERASRLVAEMTPDGSCFRVDLRLRPEGTQGPLVNSLLALERYYESWGRPWERQAWLKARPVAGDEDLGAETLALLEPFVWPRSGGPDPIATVHSLIGQIRAQLGSDDDIKLGPGGIREVEFFAQALQLVHGGRRPELREAGSLAALDRLLFAGLVSAREHRALADAYVLYRRVEHRIQLDELLQSHALPADAQRRALLARRLGFPDAAALDATLGEHRRVVSELFATLGAPPEGPRREVRVLLEPTSDRAAIVGALARLGFLDAESSADEMELLRKRPRSPFSVGATGSGARAAPLLLEEAVGSPDPDLALRRLVDLALRGAAGEAVWALVAASPPVGRLLLSLFGTSDFLSKTLVAHPELIEPLLARDSGELPGRAEHAAEIARVLARFPVEDEEARLHALRRYRNEALLRVGLRDVAGAVEPEAVGGALAALAEACIAATLETVTPAVYARWGRPETTLAALALGKLGAGELSYSSDLDLVFVFGDETARVVRAGDAGRGGGASAFEVMSRLVQRLIRGLGAFMESGRLYEVDTRLRPSGQQGALVSSLAGFARYHAGEAALWERQALIKIRTVAGDAELGARVEAIAAQHVWGGSPPASDRVADERVVDGRVGDERVGDGGVVGERVGEERVAGGRVAEEIGRLRARIEHELAEEAEDRFDIKIGRGGLLDVEFLVQYLQLIHGPRQPALRHRATLAALDALHEAGLLDDEGHANLFAGYRFLRRLENRLRIVHDRSISQLRDDTHELDKLARRLGYHGHAPGARLLIEYRERTARLRAVYARFLPVPDGS